MAKILNVVETAYRANIEEQDEPILWLIHALKNAGADVSFLLRANAVNYALKAQDTKGLSVGGCAVERPPKIDQDVADMIEKGVSVYLVQEDAEDRALESSDMISGFNYVKRSDIAQLFDQHDQVWHW